MDKMKAAVLVEPGKMVVEETALLEPEEGQVIEKNHMAAICGSDLHQVFMEPIALNCPPRLDGLATRALGRLSLHEAPT